MVWVMTPGGRVLGRLPDLPGAACVGEDPELWFKETGRYPKTAREICLRCPVRVACLAWADEHLEQFGMWGGQSSEERRRRRTRRVA